LLRWSLADRGGRFASAAIAAGTVAVISTVDRFAARLRRTNCGLATALWASAAVITLAASAVFALASTVLALRASAVLALTFLTPAAFLLAATAVATRRALTLGRGVDRVDERG